MKTIAYLLLSSLTLSAALAAPQRDHVRREIQIESAADRFQHRVRNIQEAVARGDISQAEGDRLVKVQQEQSKQAEQEKEKSQQQSSNSVAPASAAAPQ